MSSYNRVILMGNLTRAVEVKYLSSGMSVGETGLAVNESYKGQDGSRKESVVFVDLTFWGRTAEVAQQYLDKGSPVMVEGRLKLDQWQDKQSGAKRSKLSVTVEKMNFVGGPSGSRGQQGSRGQRGQGGSQGGQGNDEFDPEDIPF